MKPEISKIKKRVTAIMMCAVICVMSCLTVSAATDESRQHTYHRYNDPEVISSETIESTEPCGCCACVSCEAYTKSIIRTIRYQCGFCKYYEDVEEEEILVHICYCTTCECNCEIY